MHEWELFSYVNRFGGTFIAGKYWVAIRVAPTVSWWRFYCSF